MGTTFSGDKIYFDELAIGLSTGIFADSGSNFDALDNKEISIVGELLLVNERYIANEKLSLDFIYTILVKESYSDYVDLLQLVPEKFRGSELLQQFLDIAGVEVGTWLGYINDLEANIDKYRVSEDLIQYLADLIGFSFIGSNLTLQNKRDQLIRAIDWYKIKGSYNSLAYIGYVLGLSIDVWDMYTNDYSTFVKAPWFVGKVGENPEGLDSSYYKSPHTGVELFLDTVYGDTSGEYYLLKPSIPQDLIAYIEKVRPINVVPHYSARLEPTTNESGETVTVSGDIKTVTAGTWVVTKLYFDDFNTSSSGTNRCDNGEIFDQSTTALLNSITKFKIGNGNKGVDPSTPGFSIASVQYSGDIDSITILDDRVEYLIELPDTLAYIGLSELGLFLGDDVTLKVASTFPDIDLIDGLQLRILVKVYYSN